MAAGNKYVQNDADRFGRIGNFSVAHRSMKRVSNVEYSSHGDFPGSIPARQQHIASFDRVLLVCTLVHRDRSAGGASDCLELDARTGRTLTFRYLIVAARSCLR